MKWRWAGALSLIFIFCLLAAALRIFSTAVMSDAAYKQQSGTEYAESIIYEVCDTYSQRESGSAFDQAIQNLSNRLAGCAGAQYNFIVTDISSQPLFRLNDQIVYDGNILIGESGESYVLKDEETGDELPLNIKTSYINKEREITGHTAYAVQNLEVFTKTHPEAINVSILFAEDGQQNIIEYYWFYDNTAEYYLNQIYPDSLRAYGKTLMAAAVAAFGAYWLGLALWVFLDARRLGRGGLKWGGLTLVLNAAGLLVYIVASSQNFRPEPACMACGRPVEKRWLKCPYCGERTEEAL